MRDKIAAQKEKEQNEKEPMNDIDKMRSKLKSVKEKSKNTTKESSKGASRLKFSDNNEVTHHNDEEIQTAEKVSDAHAIFGGTSVTRKSRSNKRNTLSKKKYKSTGDSLFKLNDAENAFMPLELLRRLAAAAGQLPPAPSVFTSTGSVLFVDISGFTKLGESLRKNSVPVLASKKLAAIITDLLAVLTKTAVEAQGDVAKFAGDALLVLWELEDDDAAWVLAQRCAIAMLEAMEDFNNQKQKLDKDYSRLQIHGGLARGGILHFHLGSADDAMRWYLVAGSAASAATTLVDTAIAGEICVLTEKAKGLTPAYERPTTEPASNVILTDADAPAPKINFKASSKDKNSKCAKCTRVMANDEQFCTECGTKVAEDKPKCTRCKADLDESKKFCVGCGKPNPFAAGGGVSTGNSKPAEAGEEMQSAFMSLRKIPKKVGRTSALGKKDPIKFLRIGDDLPEMPKKGNDRRSRAFSRDISVLKDGLPRRCNVYMPSMLRGEAIERKEEKGEEMRRRVGVIFADLGDISLTSAELKSSNVDDDKLDRLNAAFVKMTRITHAFGGEIRDMLFDDKGCVYIAVFGAHEIDEDANGKYGLLAIQAAMAMANEVPDARIGVNAGSVFTGLCGCGPRHDFVVIGNEVNMAARFMVAALKGQVIVGPSVQASTEREIKYLEVDVKIGKKDNKKTLSVYRPDMAYAQHPDFKRRYQHALADKDHFRGRKTELELVQSTLHKICLSASGRSGIVAVYAGPGMGKSSLVARCKRLGRGKIKVATGTAVSRATGQSYFPFRAILEAYTGLRPGMAAEESIDAIHRLEEAKGKLERIDAGALAEILPWLTDLKSAADVKNGVSVSRISDMFIQIVTLGRELENMESTMIVFEDLHFMDMKSLELFSDLLDKMPKLQRTCFFVTTRADSESVAVDAGSNEAKRVSLYNDVVSSKMRKMKFGSLHVELRGLPESEVKSLVGGLLDVLPDDCDSSMVKKIFTCTQGVPMHVTLLVQWLEDNEFVHRNVKNECQLTEAGASADFPESIEALTLIKYAKLDDDTRRVLRTAALGGEDFDVLFIKNASDKEAHEISKPGLKIKENDVIKHLKMASEKRFVKLFDDPSRDDLTKRWSFVHDTIKDAVLKDISKPEIIRKRELLATELQKLVSRMNANFIASEGDA